MPGQTKPPKQPSSPPWGSCCPSHQLPIPPHQIQGPVPRSYPVDSCGLSMSAQRMPGTISASPRTAQAVPWGRLGWWCKVGPGRGTKVDPRELGALRLLRAPSVLAWLVPGGACPCVHAYSSMADGSRRNSRNIAPIFAPKVWLQTVTPVLSASSGLSWETNLVVLRSHWLCSSNSHSCRLSPCVRVCVNGGHYITASPNSRKSPGCADHGQWLMTRGQ